MVRTVCQVPEGQGDSQLRQGPARSQGRSSHRTSGGRRGPRRVTTAFSIRPVPPQRTPGSICGRQGPFQLWGAERWHLVAWGQVHSSTSTKPRTVPTSKQDLGPKTHGAREHTRSETVHKNGSAPVTKKAWPGSQCTRPCVSHRLIQGRAEMPLPQSVHLGCFWVAGLWENRFLLYFVRSSLSPWDYFYFILQVWRRTADREDRWAQMPWSPS